jgi:type I restriction enzyme, S subunit
MNSQKEWKVVALKDVCLRILGGGTPSTKVEAYWEGDMPWLSSADIYGVKDVKPRRFITKEAIRNSTTNILPAGGIIVVTRVGLGKLAIAPYDVCFSQDSQGLVIDELQLDKQFALIYLSKAVQRFKHESRGTTINGVTKKQLLDIQIPLPPLTLQQQIVSKIEELFSRLDTGVENLKTLQQQLKMYRQAVLKWAFEGRLTNDNLKNGELPEGWEVKTLNEIGKWTGGGTPSKSDISFWENGTILWASPKDMKVKIIKDTIDKITQAAIGQSTAKLIPKGSILFVVRSGIIRRTLPIAIAGKDLATNQDMQSLTVANLNPEYVYWYCVANEQAIREECAKDGTTVDNLDVPKLKRYPINICSPSEQNQIVQEIESRLSVCDKIEETIANALREAEALRQSILKQAFQGKLVTQKEHKAYKPKNEYFYQAQILGFITEYSKQKGIKHGEMTIAKYAFMLDRLYGVETYYDYKRWHLGPYPPEMKKVIKNKKYFIQGTGSLELADAKTLSKYNNPNKELVHNAIEDLATIFSKYTAKERSDKTELLATVCKVIEDIQSTELDRVRQSMKEWPIELPNTKFKNKSEKFHKEDTESCIKFIVKRGWDKKLIKEHS